MELGTGGYVTVNDGEKASDPVLAWYDGSGSDGPISVMSTGRVIRVKLHTDQEKTVRGIKFTYVTGPFYTSL